MKPAHNHRNLHEALSRLQSERQSNKRDDRQHLELDLKVHQIELEMQNQELKEAQRALAESCNRYATLYDFSPIGFITLNRLGLITELNLAAAALLGPERSQLANRHFFKFIHKNDRLKFHAFLNRCQQANTVITIEVRMTSGTNPPHRLFELQGHRLPSTLDEEACCQLAITDITERRQAEQTLQQSHDELETRVNERTKELLQSNQALAEANRMLKELSLHLQQVREEERTRIAQEIHDELGGTLTAIKYDICTAKRQEDGDQWKAARRSPLAIELIDSAIQSLRRIITNLRPSILDEIGLWAALEWLSHEFQEQTGILCTFKLCGEERELPPDRATAVFRIIQEALTNAAKHAGASQVQIRAKVTERGITIKVEDNGKGITREQVWNCRSFGIRGMQERAHAFHFSLRFSQNRCGGTAVLLRGPLMV